MNTVSLQQTQRRGDLARYIRYAMYPLLALATMACLKLFQDHHAWVVCAALFLTGPGAFLAADRASPAPTQWLHHAETGAHIALFVWLVTLLPSGPLSVLIIGVIVGISVMLSHLVMDSLYKNPKGYTVSEGLLCAMLVLLTAVACGLEMALATQHPKAGAMLLTLEFVAYFLFWRSAFFYGAWACFVLPPYQHQVWWPIAFSTNEVSDFWLDVVDYTSKFKNDAPNVFNALTIEQLLTFFEIAQYGGGKEWFDPLRDICKQAINEKEPRALVAWNMYEDDVQAAHYIENMLATKLTPVEMPTLELPSL